MVFVFGAVATRSTLQARLSPSPRELLATPSDLARWLVSAGLVYSAPVVTGENLATARALREAIYVLAGRAAGEVQGPLERY